MRNYVMLTNDQRNRLLRLQEQGLTEAEAIALLYPNQAGESYRLDLAHLHLQFIPPLPLGKEKLWGRR
jgi:hypothetical protein